MADWSLALLLAALFLALELMSRTFYLLAVALAFALLALVDALLHPTDVVASVLFAILALALLVPAHFLRRRLRNSASRMTTDIDQGMVVTVIAPLEGERFRVRYRGTLWTARLAQPGPSPTVGTSLVIVGREGNVLLLEPRRESPVADAPSSS